MAISAPTQSAQYVNSQAKPITLNFGYDWGAKLRMSFCKLTFTAAGFTTAAAGDISLIKMPPGKVRVISYLSRIICPIGTATCALDVGYAAYTKQDGTVAAAVGDAFIADADVGGGAIDSAFLLPAAAEFLEFDSQNGFDIVCSFEIANSPAAGSLYCMVAYQQGN